MGSFHSAIGFYGFPCEHLAEELGEDYCLKDNQELLGEGITVLEAGGFHEGHMSFFVIIEASRKESSDEDDYGPAYLGDGFMEESDPSYRALFEAWRAYGSKDSKIGWYVILDEGP